MTNTYIEEPASEFGYGDTVERRPAWALRNSRREATQLGGSPVQTMLQQISAATANGLYFLALVGALTVPDVCTGLESPNGLTSGPKYRAWFDQWVAPSYGGSMSGHDCYGLRCSLLHQGTAHPHKGLYQRVILVEPGPIGVFHNNVLNDALSLDIPTFVADMSAGVLAWLASVQATAIYQANLQNFFTRHANGIAPYVVGAPVYG